MNLGTKKNDKFFWLLFFVIINVVIISILLLFQMYKELVDYVYIVISLTLMLILIRFFWRWYKKYWGGAKKWNPYVSGAIFIFLGVSYLFSNRHDSLFGFLAILAIGLIVTIIMIFLKKSEK